MADRSHPAAIAGDTPRIPPAVRGRASGRLVARGGYTGRAGAPAGYLAPALPDGEAARIRARARKVAKATPARVLPAVIDAWRGIRSTATGPTRIEASLTVATLLGVQRQRASDTAIAAIGGAR